VATKPQIVAAPNRGNYSVKGTPRGITIPKIPVAGSLVRGKAGVDFVYRPKGPKGAGYYKKAKPTPSIVGSKPMTSTDAAGSTIATPPAVTAAAPTVPYNYSAGFASDPRYATGLASIASNQVGIGTEYGLVINRDTNASSPTYGMAMFRVPGQEAGTGNITAKIDPVTGASVYSDATGKVYPVVDLELDVRPLKQGEAGYLGGALGNTAAQSQNQQYNIGNQAAQGGAGRSGMRSSMAAMEVGALQGALSKLGMGAAGAFRGTTDQYANLLNAIFPDQADKAAALASAGTTPPAPVVAPDAAIPAAAPANTDPITQTGQVVGQALSAGPQGQFMGQVRGVLGIREISPKARIEQLRSIGRNYALTPQQRRYLDNEIEKFRKLSKVD
jgi:hypothetical protein